MAVQIQIRRDAAASWASVNPVLAEGEFGWEKDTGKRKIGNGIDAWNDLPYESGGGDSSPKTVLSDQDGLTHYTGKAPSGSGTDDSVWDIRKTVFAPDGSVSSSTTASGVKWDDRLTATYT